jgi:SNF2 family DNA or RNA helicase
VRVVLAVTRLFSHQAEGIAWLASRPRGYLAHKPGSGKTKTLANAATLVGLQRPLIACPAIVRSHWHHELVAEGFGGDAIVMSYDKLVRGGYDLMAQLILREKIDALILDEAHYLKHAGSQRAKLLLGKDGYARRLETVWPASGTPLPKHPAEIWTVLSALWPDLCLAHGLRSYEDFTRRFCVTRGSMARGTWREKVVGVKDEGALQALLAEVMHIRDAGADAPPLWWQTIRLDPAGFPLIDEMGRVETNALVRDALLAGTLGAIANDPHVSRMRRRLGELKVDPVAELVSSQLADSSEKLVIFAHHTSVIDGLTDALEALGPVVVDGRTSDTQRELRKRLFIEDPKHRVFIGQNQACGTGMDGLQKVANRAILVEPSWTASENEQLGKRIARIGTIGGRGVAQMIALAGTLDEAIVAQCKREQEMVARALPAGV